MKPEIEALVAWWLPVLGLSHWRVEVKVEPSQDAWRGKIETDYVYSNATITIAESYEGLFASHDVLEEVVLHELCHLLVQPMRSHTFDVITQLPKGTRKFPRSVAHEAEERVVDNLARTLAALKVGDFNGIGGIIREAPECTSLQG